ncbi:Mob1/phocein [Moelleriella libera RCEF 2490]|uniref:Mob1/phocein n=1 Tax=Moelleriella libera RCEF 2490 TaxID=1081109 RepID=A0A168BNC4_9HYPO|nr:Mob1/phocein [Moelleriella libera RCEF 2490]
MASMLGLPRPLPLWLNPACARHIVKGNFMTLTVEHYRNVWNFVRVIHEAEDNGAIICNSSTCPRMSAGEHRSYTWLNTNHEPIDLPAYEYMTLMQRWISDKIDDTSMFPTDVSGVSFASPSPSSAAAQPSPGTYPFPPGHPHQHDQEPDEEWLGSRSGFPRQFRATAQLIFRQIFRVYAHLYWNHFVAPFYHLNLEKQLNSCFSHFVLAATTLDMLKTEELEPMQCLIDLWAADGTFPQGSKPYLCATLERGRYIQSLSRRA